MKLYEGKHLTLEVTKGSRKEIIEGMIIIVVVMTVIGGVIWWLK